MSEQDQEVLTEEQDSLEEKAKVQGWVPPEEYGEGGVDAKTFLDRGEQYAGLLKKKVERLERKLNQSERSNEEIANHYKRALDQEKAQLEARETELRRLRGEAAKAQDLEAFNEYDNKLEQVRETRRQAAATQETSEESSHNEELNPEVESWMERNPWYNTDVAMTGAAIGYAEQLRMMNPNMPMNEFLANVDKFMRKEMPNKFKTTNTSTADVEGGGRPGGSTAPSKKSWQAIPLEDRRQAQKLIDQNYISDRETYAKYYWEQDSEEVE